MKSTSDLIEQMDDEDMDIFMETIKRRRPSLLEDQQEYFSDVADMIVGAFIWENTEQGYAFWNNMELKYRGNND